MCLSLGCHCVGWYVSQGSCAPEEVRDREGVIGDPYGSSDGVTGSEGGGGRLINVEVMAVVV